MVHYFGQPQDIDHFTRFCCQHGLFLVEDNAHGYGGEYDARFLGMFGDIGVLSPRKSFPLFNGGLLQIRNNAVCRIPPLLEQPRTSKWKMQGLLPGFLFDFLTRIRMSTGIPPVYTQQAAGRDGPLSDMVMDQASLEILDSHRLKEIVEARRTIYNVWRQFALENGLHPVFKELDPGAAPLAFPVYCNSVEKRDQWLGWGWRNGIDVFSWPTLPTDLVVEGSNAMELWKQLCCFPIHQDMNPDRLTEYLEKAG